MWHEDDCVPRYKQQFLSRIFVCRNRNTSLNQLLNTMKVPSEDSDNKIKLIDNGCLT